MLCVGRAQNKNATSVLASETGEACFAATLANLGYRVLLERPSRTEFGCSDLPASAERAGTKAKIL
jgi:hypothetical protein